MQPIQISRYFDILSRSQKAYTRQLEPVCRKWELSRSEVDVLLFLFNNSGYDRAADIVTRRGMAKSHVSLSVANLTARGLLSRADSPRDRRTVHLRLTPEGETVAAEAREAQKRFFHRLYDGIPEEALDVFAGVVHKVFENIADLDKGTDT